MPTRSKDPSHVIYSKSLPQWRHSGVGPFVGGVWIGGALEGARSVDFQAAATFCTLANRSSQRCFLISTSPSSIFFDTPPTTTSPTADKYIRRGYLQIPNSTHTNHYSHINNNQTNNQIATTTTNAHLQNRTKLQYISTPTVLSHITKNERPKPR
jgi:hypothetical protein